MMFEAHHQGKIKVEKIVEKSCVIIQLRFSKKSNKKSTIKAMRNIMPI
jgi:hypothetical protein